MKTVPLFLLTILTISGLFGCSSSACLRDIDLRGFSVTLEKGACFGQCPTYQAIIYGDLNVDFQAVAFVDPPRAPKGVVTPQAMCKILNELDESGFTDTKSAMAPVADAPITRITVKRGALHHTVEWNLTIPKNLRKLHDMLEAQTYRNPTLMTPPVTK